MVRFNCNEQTNEFFMGDSVSLCLKGADGKINYNDFYYGKVIGNTAFVGFGDFMEIYEEDEFAVREMED